MREWFENLEKRERLVVACGAVIVALVLFWSLILNPLYSGVDRVSQRVETKRVLMAWMQTAAAEIKGAGNLPVPDTVGQSLVVVIARSTQQAGLDKTLRQNQPIGDDGIRVRLERAPFDTIVSWLAQLQAGNGLSLESASFERLTTAGTVNASIVLRQPH